MWSSSCQGGWQSDLLSHWELGPLELVSRRGDQLGLATIMHAKSCLWLHIWQAQPCIMGAMKGSFTPWYLVRRKDIHLPHKCPDTKQEHTHSHKLILSVLSVLSVFLRLLSHTYLKSLEPYSTYFRLFLNGWLHTWHVSVVRKCILLFLWLRLQMKIPNQVGFISHYSSKCFIKMTPTKWLTVSLSFTFV